MLKVRSLFYFIKRIDFSYTLIRLPLKDSTGSAVPFFALEHAFKTQPRATIFTIELLFPVVKNAYYIHLNVPNFSYPKQPGGLPFFPFRPSAICAHSREHRVLVFSVRENISAKMS